MKQLVKSAVKQLGPVKRLLDERARLRDENERLRAELAGSKMWMPVGHFYSPLPDLAAVRRHEERIFQRVPRELPGIDMNETEQLQLLEAFRPYYREMPWSAGKCPGLRYHFENHSYSYSDAIFLYSMIRHLRPQRIIEVGSGNSSCLTLDTNDRFFGGAIRCTFIEPYPQFLQQLLGDQADRIDLVVSNLQDVPLERFAELGPNDILFIDSTHVSKIDSDVNYLFFEILPSLRPGVRVHIHDIFYPFEYPPDWVYEGRAWNENYVLRAFLQYNAAFRVAFFNSYVHAFHREWLERHMPLCLRCPGGSIWLEKR